MKLTIIAMVFCCAVLPVPAQDQTDKCFFYAVPN